MRNCLFMPHIDWAESRMGLTFPTAPLSPIFRYLSHDTGLNDLKNLVIGVCWSCPQGTQRALQGHHSILIILLRHLAVEVRRCSASQRSSACPAPKRADVQGVSQWQLQVLGNSVPHISLCTCLKPSGRCALAWKTYSFSHFSVFSSSVGKKKRQLVGKKM